MQAVMKLFEFNMKQSFGKLVLAMVLCATMTIAGCNAAWLDTAIKDLPILVQIALNIYGMISAAHGEDPAIVAQIQQVSTEVQNDLQLAQKLVNDYQAAASSAKPGILTQINTALSVAQTHLNDLLNAAHVKNPQLQATINGVVALAMATILAIQSLLPVPGVVARRAVRPLSPGELKSQYNFVVNQNGFSQYVIQ